MRSDPSPHGTHCVRSPSLPTHPFPSAFLPFLYTHIKMAHSRQCSALHRVPTDISMSHVSFFHIILSLMPICTDICKKHWQRQALCSRRMPDRARRRGAERIVPPQRCARMELSGGTLGVTLWLCFGGPQDRAYAKPCVVPPPYVRAAGRMRLHHTRSCLCISINGPLACASSPLIYISEEVERAARRWYSYHITRFPITTDSIPIITDALPLTSHQMAGTTCLTVACA